MSLSVVWRKYFFEKILDLHKGGALVRGETCQTPVNRVNGRPGRMYLMVA